MTDKDINKEIPEEAEIPEEEAVVEEAPEASAENEAPAENETVEQAEEKKEPEEDNDTRYMRLAADFQNYKRRVEKEKSDIYQYANEKIALDIIEVMDNFERALAHSSECADKQFAEGVSMIYKQLKTVLDKNNIIAIEDEGHEFDPNFHNAVMHVEDENLGENVVAEELQKGYMYRDTVVRHSMVKVAN